MITYDKSLTVAFAVTNHSLPGNLSRFWVTMLGCGALDLAIKTSAIRESVHEGMEMIIDEQSSNTAIYQVADENDICY